MVNVRHEGISMERDELALAVYVAYTKTGSRQSPFHRFLITHDPATAAFQAALVGKGYVSFPEFEAIRRAGKQAWVGFTGCADIFSYLDVPFFVDVVFVNGQFVFYSSWFHIAFFIRKKSRIICQRDILPLCDSRNIFQNFFLGMPSLVNILSANSQASSGYWR